MKEKVKKKMLFKVVVSSLALFLVVVLASAESEENANVYPSGIPVNVGVVSSWENTPISLEALEFLRKEAGDSAYADFIGTYHVDESATAQDQYKALVEQLS